MTTLGIILFGISAISKAIMDHCAIGTWDSKWWNKSKSWITTYDDKIHGHPVKMYKIYSNKWKNGDPDQGEAFFGSSTFLIWLTDGWHFFQMIFLNCLFLGLLLHEEPFNFYDFLILLISFKVIFEISYRAIKLL